MALILMFILFMIHLKMVDALTYNLDAGLKSLVGE